MELDGQASQSRECQIPLQEEANTEETQQRRQQHSDHCCEV